jgi:hypothetical protein
MQMTLNSIDWEEKIIIHEGEGDTQIVKIGEYIDDKLINFVETQETYYLDTKDKEIFVPSVDEFGNISWRKVEALTKHLPVNSDGTSTLIKITTSMGRSVSATKAKSFLIIKSKMSSVQYEIIPARGDEIKIGDFVPVIDTMLDYRAHPEEIISIEEVQPSRKYVYDLTVEETKTFCLSNGIFMFDTFHNTGAKANVSLTFPSYKELINGSKTPKNTNMNIYFKEKKSLEETARFGFQNIEYHELKDFLLKDGEIVRARTIDINEEPIPDWYKLSLEFTPQYKDILPNKEELIKLLARNNEFRKKILQKMDEK